MRKVVVMRVMQIGGLVTVVSIGLLMLVLWRREKQGAEPESAAARGAPREETQSEVQGVH